MRGSDGYPAAAAAFAAGIIYVWGEAAFRLLFTYFPSFDARWVLWNGRVGDVAAMWLTISGVSLVICIILCMLWRHRKRVGTFAGWMIVLIGSAAAAPMIGEIGEASGPVANGVGSMNAVAVIAYSILGVVVIACAAAFVRLRARR